MTFVQILKRFGPLMVIGLLIVVALASGVWRHISVTELQIHSAQLRGFVLEHPILSVAIYVTMYIVLVVACLPGPGVMTLAGGYLFGALIGAGAALAGCTVGSTLVYLACRTAFGDWAAGRAGPVVQRIEAGFSRNAFSYLLTLRLLPVMPFFATNVAAGLLRVPLSSLVGATLLGTAPVCLIVAGLGAGLGRLFDRGAKVDATLFEQPQVLLPLLGLALLSAGPIAWRLWRRRVDRSEAP